MRRKVQFYFDVNLTEIKEASLLPPGGQIQRGRAAARYWNEELSRECKEHVYISNTFKNLHVFGLTGAETRGNKNVGIVSR